MKKLVMMLVLVAAVVSAKAASVDWTVGATAAQDGYTVYLLAAEPGEFASVADLASAAVGSATVAKSGRSYTTGPVTSAGDGVTKTADYYFAIVSSSDATSFNYVAATGLGAKVYDPAAQESSAGNFNTMSAAQIAAGTSKSFGGGGDDPIPEPTSGLLLLVGGAMLALRRRHA
ncbi:MAG: PEP-CTERM sorting domain-containing protein [bacterium]|nr:PEP-CTERM sorting domain-containing protein [bacterium]